MIPLSPNTPHILRLPNRFLLALAEYLDIRTLNSFIQTNRHLATLLNPSLKAAAVLHGVNGQDALLIAARYGSLDLARFALEKGNKVTVTDAHGQTPLHWAAISGQESMVRLLLEHGANPRVLCSSPGGGVRPLFCAVKHGHDKTIDVLLSYQYGALVTSAGKDENGGTILHWAALQYPHILQRLVQCARLYRDVGFDINVRDNHGETPIHWAARAGQYRTVRALLGVGAMAEPFNNAGKTPLHVVFDGEPQEETIESLLNGGAGINTEGPFKETALHMAVRSGSCPPSLVIYMVENRAKVSAVTEVGQTALHLAAIRGDELISWYLLDHRADINAMDSQDKTALHCAVGLGIGFWRNPVVNLLLEKGASVKIKDKNGETAIQEAMRPDSGLEEWERVKIREVYPQLERPATVGYEEPVSKPEENVFDRVASWTAFEREQKQKTPLSLGAVKKLFHIKDIKEGFRLPSVKPNHSRGSRYRLARS